MDPCRVKFQVIRTNGSRVIAVGSWPENIGNFCLLYLQFPVILTSDCNDSETVCPNHLKFAVQVVPTMDPWQLKFQLIRTNGSRVIAIGSLS